MQDLVKQVALYKMYSVLDTLSAYHQTELPESDRIYTAFQTDGSLWKWKRIALGLPNAVPDFQRVIDDIIKENDCKSIVPYLNNITVGGNAKEEHNENLENSWCSLCDSEKYKHLPITESTDLSIFL